MTANPSAYPLSYVFCGCAIVAGGRSGGDGTTCLEYPEVRGSGSTGCWEARGIRRCSALRRKPLTNASCRSKLRTLREQRCTEGCTPNHPQRQSTTVTRPGGKRIQQRPLRQNLTRRRWTNEPISRGTFKGCFLCYAIDSN